MIKRQLTGIKRVLTFPGQGQLIQRPLLQQLQPLQQQCQIPIPQHLQQHLFDPALSPEFFLKSSNLQPSVVYISLLLLELLHKQGITIECSYLMGHSLGELTALILNGVIPKEVGVHMAHARGEFMEDCVRKGVDYGMTAFLFKDSSEAMNVIKERVTQFASLDVANINGHNQCVVSGEFTELAELSKLLKKDIKAKGTKLDVKLPFHNKVLDESKHRFRELVYKQCDIDKGKQLEVPIVSNLTGEISHTHGEALENFIEDFTKPVQFVKALERVTKEEVSFVNIGPNSKVIQGLVKRMDRGQVLGNITVEGIEDVDPLIAALKL